MGFGKAELLNANNEYFIATENGNQQGYIKLKINEKLAGFEDLKALEVERIYVHKKASGKHLGTELMQTAMNRARELKKDIVFFKSLCTH